MQLFVTALKNNSLLDFLDLKNEPNAFQKFIFLIFVKTELFSVLANWISKFFSISHFTTNLILTSIWSLLTRIIDFMQKLANYEIAQDNLNIHLFNEKK